MRIMYSPRGSGAEIVETKWVSVVGKSLMFLSEHSKVKSVTLQSKEVAEQALDLLLNKGFYNAVDGRFEDD